MRQIWKSFRALYFASLMMLIGSGLLSTYLALRLAADNVDGLWVGALMAANYFGLVLGGKIGHRLIARVGHIRAYSACAGIVGAAVLGHGLVDWLPAWLVLRTIVGLGMMCQYMVIESWLNEQADANQRGLVFSGYMIASYLGLVLGQLILVMHPGLGLELLMLVALVLRPKQRRSVRLLALAGSVILMLGILFTYSRQAYLIALFAIMVLLADLPEIEAQDLQNQHEAGALDAQLNKARESRQMRSMPRSCSRRLSARSSSPLAKNAG